MWWYTPLVPTLGRQRQADLCEFKAWWHMPLIPALGRQKKPDLCEFKASQGYTGRLC